MEWLALLLLIPLSVTCLTVFFFFSDGGERYSLFGVYTLISALLLTVLPLIWTLYFFYQKKTQGYYDLEINLFHVSFAVVALSWSCVSLGIFYSSADEFPSLSGYGGFTLFYMVLFSLLFFGGLLLILFIDGDENKMFKIIIPVFVVPPAAIALGILLGTDDVFTQFPFFFSNMVAAVVGTLLTLLVGAYTHEIVDVSSKSQFLTVLLLQSLGGIGFPLLPASVLFNLITLLLNNSLFSGDTYGFACLAITNSYFLGIAGLAGMAFHNYFTCMFLYFPGNLSSLRPKFIALMPLFQNILQVLVLFGYFLFSEQDLPLLAAIGAITMLIFFIADILIQVLVLILLILKQQYEQASFGKKSKMMSLQRGLILGLGSVFGAIYLGLAQQQNNAFYEYPQFSLFMVLCVFQCVHTCYAVLPFQQTVYTELYTNFIWQNSLLQTQAILREAAEHPQLQINIDQVVQEIKQETELESLTGEPCAICLSGLFRGTFFEESGSNLEVSKLRKCGHYFHSNCIKHWLSGHRECPLDRLPQ